MGVVGGVRPSVNTVTRRSTRRDERVTVEGPVQRLQPDGMSRRGYLPHSNASLPPAHVAYGSWCVPVQAMLKYPLRCPSKMSAMSTRCCTTVLTGGEGMIWVNLGHDKPGALLADCELCLHLW